MNYFPFHLGDYAAHTGHLEPMEDLAYRRLLDQYYLRECPLPADIEATAKLVRMRSMKSDVEAVLREFFVLTDAGWRHARCDAEIEKMQDKQAKARASGIASANARKSYAERARQAKPTDAEEKPTNAERSLGDLSTDVQLPTPTPTPTPISNTAKAVGASRRKAQTALPDDFMPNEVGATRAEEKRIDLAAELEKFRNYHAAKGSVMADWQAAWRTWVGNARPGTGAVGEPGGPKRGSEEYAALHRNASWWRDAGFDSVWSAMSAKCWHNTAHQFRDGKRVEVAA